MRVDEDELYAHIERKPATQQMCDVPNVIEDKQNRVNCVTISMNRYSVFLKRKRLRNNNKSRIINRTNEQNEKRKKYATYSHSAV